MNGNYIGVLVISAWNNGLVCDKISLREISKWEWKRGRKHENT
jgi:hypothetical protein